jgi:hypothetical protein
MHPVDIDGCIECYYWRTWPIGGTCVHPVVSSKLKNESLAYDALKNCAHEIAIDFKNVKKDKCNSCIYDSILSTTDHGGCGKHLIKDEPTTDLIDCPMYKNGKLKNEI